MTKGKVYRLVPVDGCRVVHIPLALWPSITGMLSDNEYQFELECWEKLVREVLNVGCQCLPESYALFTWLQWTTGGTKTFEVAVCPAGKKRRIKHGSFYQVSSGTTDATVSAVKGSNLAIIAYDAAVPSQSPRQTPVDVFQVEGDFVRFVFTPSVTTGIFYVGLWGEEWTL